MMTSQMSEKFSSGTKNHKQTNQCSTLKHFQSISISKGVNLNYISWHRDIIALAINLDYLWNNFDK